MLVRMQYVPPGRLALHSHRALCLLRWLVTWSSGFVFRSIRSVEFRRRRDERSTQIGALGGAPCGCSRC